MWCFKMSVHRTETAVRLRSPVLPHEWCSQICQHTRTYRSRVVHQQEYDPDTSCCCNGMDEHLCVEKLTAEFLSIQGSWYRVKHTLPLRLGLRTFTCRVHDSSIDAVLKKAEKYVYGPKRWFLVIKLFGIAYSWNFKRFFYKPPSLGHLKTCQATVPIVLLSDMDEVIFTNKIYSIFFRCPSETW